MSAPTPEDRRRAEAIYKEMSEAEYQRWPPPGAIEVKEMRIDILAAALAAEREAVGKLVEAVREYLKGAYILGGRKDGPEALAALHAALAALERREEEKHEVSK